MDVKTAKRMRDDPLFFGKVLWPHVNFFKEQREIILSVRDNDETFVPAANMMGKDFTAGFVCLWFFLTHHPVRIITTSVKDDHLRVLWGEIGRFVQTAAHPLDMRRGGLVIVNHREIRKLVPTGEMVKGKPVRRRCDLSYMLGMVSEKGEGMAGHHAKHTLCVIDEASGVDDLVYTQQATWSKRLLAFGNCNPCPPTHWFQKNIKMGDQIAT